MRGLQDPVQYVVGHGGGQKAAAHVAASLDDASKRLPGLAVERSRGELGSRAFVVVRRHGNTTSSAADKRSIPS